MIDTAALIPLIVVIFTVIVFFAVKPRAYYSEKHPVIDEIRSRISKISPAFSKIPIRTGKKSYTEDKQLITLCIQNPDSGDYYDINVLMYVALHELSHCITKADGKESHGTEFKGNFSTLLKEAAKKGVYDPRQPIPETYCGVNSDT